jgi:ribosomal protein S18 acetylase RimI-like enzyme
VTSSPSGDQRTTPESSIVVRPARDEDVDDIVGIGVRSWVEGYRGVVPAGLLPDAAGLRARIRQRIAERVPSIAVGVLDTHVCGWITFGASRDADAAPSVAEIWALNVDPAAWRRGVGRELVGYALQRLARGPFAEVSLWTFRDTPRSRSFYEALGFETDGSTQRRDASGGTIEVRYRTALANGGWARF